MNKTRLPNIFKRRQQETRAAEQTESLLRALSASAGITSENALNIPTVAGCVEYISKTIAMLPIKLYRENENEVEELKSDKRIALLNDDTGDLLNAYQMKKAFVRDTLLDGNGYIYINRKRNEVQSLHYVKQSSVCVTTNNRPIFKQAEILVDGQRYYDFDFIKLTYNTADGVRGNGIVAENNAILTAVYNALLFENFLVKNGGSKKGFLQSEKRLSKEAMDELKRAWHDLYSQNQNNMMILNEGIKFQESSNTLVEMQLNENKKTNAEEICRLFNLSPAVISGQATEDEYVSAFKTAVLPIIKAIETEINKTLLLESEKAICYFAFDITESLKGDTLKRYQAYQIGLQSNFLQPDEIRYKEDLKPLGLDFIKLGLNDVLYNPKTKTVYTPNTDKTTTLTGE